MRGRFKKLYGFKRDKLHTLDVAAVGDEIDFELNADKTGVITKIYERKNYLSRKAPKIKGASFRGERLEQIISANVDDLYIVSSADSPNFNNRVVDRLIVTALSAKLTPHLIINKLDLVEYEEFEFWKELYESVNCKVFLTEAVNSKGIEDIRENLIGKTSVFWGQSGVGKSSILNVLYPELMHRVGEISVQTNKGTHTTVTSILSEVDADTFVIDTPGIREIEPYGIRKIDLCHYFDEFTDYINDCKFNTCIHLHEPGCAVIDAVENDYIAIERYESYLNLLDSIEDGMLFK